uniref:SNF2 histone linker PHD RING helicase n=1 Tax=Callorhinchus milii TaxID=7868 RepID=A0A4W3HRE0_CALMI
MSCRRKRATPLRVGEDKKKKLCWNMHDDLKEKDNVLDNSDCGLIAGPSFLGNRQEDGNLKLNESVNISILPEVEDGEDSLQDIPSSSVKLNFTVSPHHTDGKWKAMLGEFTLQLISDQEQDGLSSKESDCPEEMVHLVRTSLSSSMLQNIVWLQKKKVLGFFQKKVCIYLLERGLGKLEFLSEGSCRMRKTTALIQKLMEYFYDLISPVNEEEADKELERQNIEELYDFVRRLHQQEILCTEKVQHPLLIPALRPYQHEAVSWMLQQEHYKTPSSCNKTALHLLWKEFTTKDENKLYYNPYTGYIIRERPLPGPEWPGGILADEMGLGKTVEILALILTHTREELKQETLTLPEGKSVNYYIPSPPSLRSRKPETKKNELKPKEKVNYPSLRVMLTSAIKDRKIKKGASANAIYKFITATYKYDVQRNRPLIKKTLEKLVAEQVVEQVKGHGLAGSFRMGKNYKEQMKQKQKDGAVHAAQKEMKATIEMNHESKSCSEELHSVTNHNSNLRAQKADSYQKTETVYPSGQQMVFPFNTSRYRFECICGKVGLADYKARVQCLNCHLWQHAECVNYKEENLKTRPFYCPHCLVAMKPVPTSATLIISPSSICHQWVDEINRHVRSSSLCILVYQGVKKHGFIQPHMLAKHDIVITTYDVLRSELNYVDIPHSNSDDGRRFRNQKRYMAIPSPLVAVEWWRICLDEAQMVECATAKAAEMCLRLSAINRWCVTGTPVQRGLEDLYGLVLFLGVDPYWVKHWWDQLLYQPYRRKNPFPLYSLIAKIMWRTAKKDVLDQIQIPPQTEEVHWLQFSPVERHFYHRQHEFCSQDALQKLRKISDWSIKLSILDRRTVASILYPLLRLRQACCHPQAVRGEFLPLQKSTMTMEELLKSLQKKCCTACEEAHRQLVCALNGLAGIHIIKDEFTTAAEYYREVLRSSEEHKSKLKTDSLQRLHATHNLMELLESKHPGIPPTLRDHRLRDETEQHKQHYMNKSDAEVSEAYQALQSVQQNMRDLQRKVNPWWVPWWLGIIENSRQDAMDEELVIRVQNELSSNSKHQSNKFSMAEKFRDSRGLQFLLTVQMEELRKSQQLVQDAVKNLEAPPSQQAIHAATICHLRPVRFPLNNCLFCKADELFTEYESKLFSHSVKGQKAIFEERIEDEDRLVDDRLPTTSRGLWAASETERSLKAILTFGKVRRMDAMLIEEGNIFMEQFEAVKKEYKLLHEYWMVLRDRVSAIDELAMATERFRIRLPDEPKPNLPVLHIIEPHEVEQNQMKLLNDKLVATSQLQKKLGQLLYLTNLEKSQDSSTGAINPEPCPICARPLGQQWAVLTCGHCFCNDCIAIIIEQYSTGARRSAIKCAVCRQTTTHKEISYVFTAETANKDDDIPIKGSHSTKVEAVIRTLKKIQLRYPGAKALVFSTWQDVLEIIGKALFDNNLEFVQIDGLHKFQENLSAFKYDAKINILLLPLHTASNGLNIIEATHVLLVEPILNPAHELQAIGRVHRIGQTKPTVVHRFLIKATIEEKMQSMLKSAEKRYSQDSNVISFPKASHLYSQFQFIPIGF